MGYGWSCRSRLAAIGLVWDVGSDVPRYEIAKMERRSLRRRTRLQAPGRETRIERDRWRRRFIAGRLGEWPHWRPDQFRRARVGVGAP